MIRTYYVNSFNDPSAAGLWLSHLEATYRDLKIHGTNAVIDPETSLWIIILTVSYLDSDAEGNR